jgi:CHASE2 domain-containing sensor protein
VLVLVIGSKRLRPPASFLLYLTIISAGLLIGCWLLVGYSWLLARSAWNEVIASEWEGRWGVGWVPIGEFGFFF